MTAIGIDLGTTYSCVGVFMNDRVEIIANDQGNRTTPSYVAFNEDERLIGEAAKNQTAMNPTNTVFDAKRLIGRRFNDREVRADMGHWPFKVVAGASDKPAVQVQHKGETRTFQVEEISGMVLQKMKGDRRGLPRHARQQGRHHGPRVLQRLAAPGHEGRRPDRGPRGPPHHQRADRRGDRVRARQQVGRGEERPDLRPRRRHVRRLAAHHRRGHLRGQGDRGRHAPRRRGLRQPHGQPLRDRVQAQAQDGHQRQRPRDAPSAHGLRARQAHALVVDPGRDRDRLALRGRRLLHEHHARPLRGPLRRPLPRLHRPRPARAHRREARQDQDPRDRARRRVNPHPQGAAAAQGLLQRQGAQQDHQPRRGRRVRRRRSGRHPRGRQVREGLRPPPARRHAPLARHRDRRRRDDDAHQAQHDDPRARQGDVLDLRRQPARRDYPGLRGRARPHARLQQARHVRPDRHPARAPRRPEDRGVVRHRRQRHPPGHRRGQELGQPPADHDHQRLRPPLQGRHRAHGRRRGAVQGRRREGAREGRGAQRPRELRLLPPQHHRGREVQGQDLRRGQGQARRRDQERHELARHPRRRREGGVRGQAQGARAGLDTHHDQVLRRGRAAGHARHGRGAWRDPIGRRPHGRGARLSMQTDSLLNSTLNSDHLRYLPYYMVNYDWPVLISDSHPSGELQSAHPLDL
ncbi:Heat shock protein 70 family [Carpediemonas membranifera]|uniref:Heat shock protein 70 family n=1 Tax=Carpediemonas membranifera TaxID=201153 RepID=A0A8J6BAE1_9EUKA|nr:Heat shock protein 70 family [Carpediemonas membranifera]|eukprot:KAG9396614.1 Heat shock protein 70 family [Carpediemonas membranifera]